MLWLISVCVGNRETERGGGVHININVWRGSQTNERMGKADVVLNVVNMVKDHMNSSSCWNTVSVSAAVWRIKSYWSISAAVMMSPGRAVNPAPPTARQQHDETWSRFPELSFQRGGGGWLMTSAAVNPSLAAGGGFPAGGNLNRLSAMFEAVGEERWLGEMSLVESPVVVYRDSLDSLLISPLLTRFQSDSTSGWFQFGFISYVVDFHRVSCSDFSMILSSCLSSLSAPLQV